MPGMIRSGTLVGHRTIHIDNDEIEVVVLPDRGAEIHQLIHRPSGTTFLLETPGGLPPHASDRRTDFLEGYAGGWQELFPNVNEACRVDGVDLPFHGEVTLRPWQVHQAPDDDATTVELSTRADGLGVRLERRMRVAPGAPELQLLEIVTNERDRPVQVAWGHHIVLGGTFLKAGCRVELPGGRITTPAELYEPETARLAPGQREPWPLALGRDGEPVDLRLVPGPEAHSHDDVFVTELPAGWVVVSDPVTDLAIRLEWEVDVFGCLVNWRPLGGADRSPLTGIYGLGIEPWTSPDDLAHAVERGGALRLEAGESRTTRLTVRIERPGDGPIATAGR